MYKHVALLLILGVAGAAAQMRTNKPLLEAIEGNAQLSQLAAAIKTVSSTAQRWTRPAGSLPPPAPSCRLRACRHVTHMQACLPEAHLS